MRFVRIVILACVFVAALAGCSTFSGSGAASDPANANRDYYYEVFADVAIPKDMSSSSSDRVITYSADGVAVGVQQFTGRVEVDSLVNVMKQYMLRDGWSLRSMIHAKHSVLVFERQDRICSLYISDGMVSTTMMVFVTPKLADGAVPFTPPSPQPAASSPTSSGSGVQSYPAGGFSNSGGTSLSQ